MNWTVEETRVLLCAWSDERIQRSLAENLRNRHVFKQLSARMSEMGFCRSPQQCRLRVKTLKASYARARLQRSVNDSQPCTFKYFIEMDAVLGRRSVGSDGGPYIAVSDQMTDCHFRSRETKQCPLSSSNQDVTGHRFTPLESREPSQQSLEEERCRIPWLDPDIKSEGEELSADVLDFTHPGFPRQQRDACQEDDPESPTRGIVGGVLLQ